MDLELVLHVVSLIRSHSIICPYNVICLTQALTHVIWNVEYNAAFTNALFWSSSDNNEWFGCITLISHSVISIICLIYLSFCLFILPQIRQLSRKTILHQLLELLDVCFAYKCNIADLLHVPKQVHKRKQIFSKPDQCESQHCNT